MALTAQSGWRVGVDVGGTFTDLMLTGDDGALRVVKVPSVPSDPAAGVIHALEHAAAELDLSLGNLLQQCSLFCHGSTIATNTLLERKGARVGLLTTQGHRDSIEIRRGRRDNPWDHRTPFPEVLVPRYLRLPVAGRMDRDGIELEPLSRSDVERAMEVFRREGVESVAICFINGYVNADHEGEAAQILSDRWVDVSLSVSSLIAPIMGEYERSTTAVMNAYVGPRTVGYLQSLNERLGALGFAHQLLLIQNNGGSVSVDQVANKPVTLLLSGPAAGVGALNFYSPLIGSTDLISMEIGGTSCDVILMNDGAVAVVDELKIAGYDLVVPSADVHTIGAGGGTLAGVDDGGLLWVGPAGAGASPGPAAYGRGGTEPTITDAQLVLGRLRPGAYGSDGFDLDPTLARRAIEERVAVRMGIGPEEAAAGMVQLLEQKLLQAVQRISVERGFDPRRFVLVASGGAGPMHGASVGRMLGCEKVYVPRLSGVFCALGMLHANVRQDHVRAHVERLDEIEPRRLNAVFGELDAAAMKELEDGGITGDRVRLERALDLRYVGQQWDVRVMLDSDDWTVQSVRDGFEAEHERLFGHHQPGGRIEITKLRVAGVGLLPPWQPTHTSPVSEAARPKDRRRVFLDAHRGWAELDVYSGNDLGPGHRIAGPLMVEESTTTVLVGPHDVLEVDPGNNFVIHLSRET